MHVVSVPLGARGCDTDTALTAEDATGLKRAGFDYVVRYIGGLTPSEAQAILDVGLGLQLVTYSRAPGWTPSATVGAEDGALDVSHLKALGAPPGTLTWIDLEGAAGSAASTAAWVQARAAAIVSAGFVAGLYVGACCVLSAAELYAIPSVTRYWRAFNRGIPEPACGFCQVQCYPPNQVVAGVEVDRDFAQSDYAGRVASMLSMSAPS